MDEIAAHNIKLDNINFTYYIKGQGRPLALLPALHSTVERVAPLISYLSKDFQVIYPDFPGIGTNHPLGHHRHTAANYATILKQFILKLNLKDYILCGICLGTVIAVRAMQQHIRPPLQLLLIEPLYDASCLIIPTFYKPFITAFKLYGKNNRIFEKGFDKFIHSERLLELFYKISLFGKNNQDEAIKNQIKLTQAMYTRSYLELAYDLLTLDMSREQISSNQKCLLVYYEHDEILDIEKSIQGMMRIFPKAIVKRVRLKEHSPMTDLEKNYISQLLQPLESELKKFR